MQIKGTAHHEPGAGYRPASPTVGQCLPPGAVCNRDAHQSPGKRPVGLAWAQRARRETPEAATLPASPDALNTGILCDGLRAVDVDIEDHAMAQKVRTLLNTLIGRTIIRTRANSAKFLALYRAAKGEPPKRTLAAAQGKVEVLGHGQQFVAFGWHPSGAELEWLDGSPHDLPRQELRSVTEAKIEAFLAACKGLLGEGAVARPGGRTPPCHRAA